MNFTITNDSVVVIHAGSPVTVRRGAPNFQPLVSALIAGNEEEAVKHLTVKKSLQEWCSGGDFTVQDNTILFKGEALPESLNKRILEMTSRGESPSSFMLFWERVQRNPSWRSVQQLWNFLNHCGIPLTEDGCFLAYKGVNNNLTDVYTGTVDNTPGLTHEMDRNKVSDDPDQACHYGFHVGALEYARNFGSRTMICKVDPEHVVCVPNDYSFQKMRVHKYTVMGFYGAQLADTTHAEEETDPDLVDDLDLDLDRDDEEQPYPEDSTSFKPVKVSARWRKLHGMKASDLLKQPIEKLRKYATHGLKIVGASKIPGGRVNLVTRILEVRDGKR